MIFILFYAFNHMLILFFYPILSLITTSLACVCICFVELEDSSWTDHCGPFFPSHPTPLSRFLSLEGFNATGASEAQERSLGKEEQRPVRLQPSPLRTSSPLSPLFFPPLFPSPLFPLPTGQRPKLRLQTRKWAH